MHQRCDSLKALMPTLKEVYPFKTSVFRFFVAIFLFAFYSAIASHAFPYYTNGVYKATEFFIYHLQAYGEHTCTIAKPSKVIPIEGNSIVIATPSKNGYTFQNGECKNSSKPNKKNAITGTSS